MKLVKVILLFLALTCFMSCSMTKFKIQKNDRATEKAIASFFKTNGNAFFLRSTYSTKSTVWSYEKGYVLIKRLENGKEEFFKEVSSFAWYSYANENEVKLSEFNGCVELDGDLFGFKFKDDKNIRTEDYPVNIACMVGKKYESEFIKKLVEEMIAFIL